LVRTRGIKGELVAAPLSPDPGRAREVFIGDRSYEVERFWIHQEQPVFKFRGVDSMSDAEKLVGQLVTIPKEQRLELPQCEYYQSDLIGAAVVDVSGRILGVLDDWQELGGQTLLAVKRAGGGELLIPFNHAICKVVDVEGKSITVDLPEGLEDLNK
jgi:16S rRNA processing protein RimM